MLKKIAPQKIKNVELGYIVQTYDRYTVEYIEPHRAARIEVDFGTSVGLYQDSLKQWLNGDVLTKEDKAMVLSRIEEAVKFMGSKTEIVDANY